MSKRVCLIQLNRFGDLVQTLQAVKDLKQEDPTLSVTLIARKRFATELSFLLTEVFDEIFCVGPELFFSKGDQSLDDGCKKLDLFLTELNQLPFDEAINLSFCQTSSLLMRFIQAKTFCGMIRNQKAQIVVEGEWAQFLYATTLRGPHNPFHLIDCFKNMMGGTGDKSFWFQDFVKKTNGKKIAIHPFASRAKKRWGIHLWIELTQNLLTMLPDAEITVLGSADEQAESLHFEKSEILQQFQSRIFVKTGGLTLQQSFEEIHSAALFIGHDSLCAHFAAITQTPSITLALGTVRPQETSPYSPDSYTFSPDISCFPCFPATPCELLPCHQKLKIGDIAQAASFLIQHKTSWQLPNSKTYLETGAFREGYYHTLKLDHNDPSSGQVVRDLYFLLWGLLLANKELELPPPELSKKSAQDLQSLLHFSEILYDSVQHGQRFASEMKNLALQSPLPLPKIQTLADKILEIDRLQQVIAQESPFLSTVVDFYYVKKRNTAAGELWKLALATESIFHEQAQAVQILYELVEKVLAHYDKKILGIEKQKSA